MKLLQLRAENFKRVELVEIRPDGSLTTIGGDNEAGKSSTLDAFEFALEGPQKDTPQPIREGADKAVIVAEFDDLLVKRTITPKGQSLIVENKAGARFPSPQAMLDKLFTRIGNDPRAFIDMKEDAQLETLKKLAGLDFSEMDTERKAIFEARTEQGRDERRLAAELQAIPVIVDPPLARVSMDQLTTAFANAECMASMATVAEAAAATAEAAYQSAMVATDAANKRVLELEAALAAARHAEEAANVREREAGDRRQQTHQAAQSARTAVPDTSALREQLRAAEMTNARFDAHEQREKKAADLDRVKAAVAEMTAQIESIDTTKALMLKQATFPLDGLTLTDSGVFYNGIPLKQVCASDQIRIGVAVAIALNPQMRVMLIRDGSLIGPERRRLLEQLATEHDAQILMEVVTTNADEVSVLIEDGRVVGAPEPVAP